MPIEQKFDRFHKQSASRGKGRHALQRKIAKLLTHESAKLAKWQEQIAPQAK